MTICACCGNPGGRCGRCARMHFPAIDNGRCEGCQNEVDTKMSTLQQIKANVTGHVLHSDDGLSASAFHVHLETSGKVGGVWSELYTTMGERDAFLKGVEAASALLGARKPDVKSYQGRIFKFTTTDVMLNEEEKAFLKNDKKIPAIKAVRIRTGLGLKEAKEVIDRFEAGEKNHAG